LIDSKDQARASPGVYGFYPLIRAARLFPDLQTAWRRHAGTPFRHELDHAVYVNLSFGLSSIVLHRAFFVRIQDEERGLDTLRGQLLPHIKLRNA